MREPLIGRHKAVAALTEALEHALRGEVTVALVSGEAGIGKTRLLEELTRLASARGVPVAWGRATDEDGAPAYWPWQQVSDAVPALCEIGELDELRGLSLDAAKRFELFESFGRFIARAAAADGLVIVLDDLHWADAGTLVQLTHVIKHLRTARILLVGSHRPCGRLADVAHAVSRHPVGLHLDLSGLAVSEVAELLGTRTIANAVHERTGGNPLFVRELRRLLDAGLDLDSPMPVAIRTTVEQRLGLLPDTTSELLATAAVLGATIDPILTASITDRELADVIDDLERAEAANLLVGKDFAHDLYREVAQLTVPAAERKRIQLAAAEYYEAHQPDRRAEIAHHRLAALPLGDPNLAAEAAAVAARGAIRQLAFERAEALYARALDVASTQRCTLLTEAARAAYLANDVQTAMRRCAEAADLAQQAGDAEALGHAALALHEVSEPGWMPRVEGWCRRALEGLPAGDRSLRARLLAQLSLSWSLEHDRERMLEASAEAVAMARRLADDTALYAALRARQLARSAPDGNAERLALGAEMLQLGRRNGYADAEFWGHLWRFDALVQAGDIDAADAALTALGPVVERLHRPVVRWHLLRSRAGIALGRGDFAEASRLIERSLELAVGPSAGYGARTIMPLVISTTSGKDLESPALVDDPQVPVFLLWPACWHLAFGRTAEARAIYARLPATEALGLAPYTEPVFTALRTTLAVGLGDVEGARAAYDRLLPWADLHAANGAGVPYTLGSVQYYLGIAAELLGRRADAARHLEAAVTSNEGLPPFAERARQALAGLGDTDVLSARQREIADLVAEGLTNREIAAKLHIAERTAENHLHHIMTKLDLRNRSQLAVWAHRRAT